MEKYAKKHREMEALEILDLVIRLQSLKGAALVLNLPVSSISATVSMLRKQFSDILYRKSENKLLPTSLAIMLLGKLEEHRKNTHEKNRLLVKKAERNNLIICCETHVAPYVVPLLVQLNSNKIAIAVKHKVPPLEDELLANELLNNHVDVIFNYKPIIHPDIITRFLFKEDVCIVCSKSHPRLSDAIVVEEYLQEHHAILDGYFLPDSDENHDPNKKVLKENIHFCSESVLDLLAAIETSEMVTVIPCYLYQKLHSSFDVKRLYFKFEIVQEYKKLHVSYRKDKKENTPFRSILELIK